MKLSNDTNIIMIINLNLWCIKLCNVKLRSVLQIQFYINQGLLSVKFVWTVFCWLNRKSCYQIVGWNGLPACRCLSLRLLNLTLWISHWIYTVNYYTTYHCNDIFGVSTQTDFIDFGGFEYHYVTNHSRLKVNKWMELLERPANHFSDDSVHGNFSNNS